MLRAHSLSGCIRMAHVDQCLPRNIYISYLQRFKEPTKSVVRKCLTLSAKFGFIIMFWGKKAEHNQESTESGRSAPSPSSEGEKAADEAVQPQTKPCCSKKSKDKEEQAAVEKRSEFQFGGAPNGGITLTGVCTPVGSGQDIEACLWRADRNEQKRKNKYEIIW